MPRSEHTDEINRPERGKAHIRDYFVIVNRHKWLIFAALVVTLASTILYLSRTKPMYKTSAKLLIGQEKTELSLFKELGFLGQAGLSEEMETYCELLKTHRIMREVVDNTQLHRLLHRPGNAISLGSSAVRSDIDEEMGIRQATKELQDMVQIGPVRNTRIIEVTVSGTDPVMVTDLANELANVFIKSNLQNMKGEAKVAYDFISGQLKQVQEKLRNAEEKLRRFKEKESVIELTEEAKITLEKLSVVEANYNTAIAQRQETEARLEATRRELEKQTKTIISSTTIVENPLVRQLKSQLYDFEADLAGLLDLYPEDASEVRQVKTRISQTKEKLAREVERIVTNETSSINPIHQTLVTRLMQLESDAIAYGAMAEAQKIFIEQYRSEVDQLPSKELQLARLTRDKNVSDQTYMMLMQHRQEAQFAQAVQVGNISIADPAIRPLEPYSPKPKLALILGGVLGLFLGVGFAFFLEYLDDTVKTPDDVTQRTNAVILGMVPRVAEARGSKIPPILLKSNSKNLSSEAYRSMRTNLLFSDIDNPPKTVVITSASMGEGKTLTCVNLAAAMAQLGHNVLLVDADLRRPMLYRVFNADRDKGLSTVLMGELAIDEAIIKTDIPNLSLLTSGVSPPNPSEILGSLRMKELLINAREQYDIVIFDSAPVLGMTDTPVLCMEVDGTLLVIEAGGTTHKALKIMNDQLEQLEARVFGVVLNNVYLKRDKYYYSYYYSSSYEGEGEEKMKKRRKRKTKDSWHSSGMKMN